MKDEEIIEENLCPYCMKTIENSNYCIYCNTDFSPEDIPKSKKIIKKVKSKEEIEKGIKRFGILLYSLYAIFAVIYLTLIFIVIIVTW